MESRSLGPSVWNLTSSWSCPALPLLQIGETGVYSLQGHEELPANPMLGMLGEVRLGEKVLHLGF